MVNRSLAVQVTLVVASALAVPLSFPPYGFWPLMLPSVALLVAAVTHTTTRRAFYLGMLHGMLGYGLSLYWLCTIFGPAAIALYGILALFTAAFCTASNDLVRRVPSPIAVAAMTGVLWTGIEFYRSDLFFLRFPWITPGTALGPTYLSPLLGVYAATFLVVAAAALWLHRRTVPLAIIVSLGVLLLGTVRPKPIDNANNTGLTVTLVQCEACDPVTLMEMTRSAAAESPDIVVWPEYSLPYDIRQNEAEFNKLIALCADLDIVLIVGTKTTTGDGPLDWRNTALTMNRHGVVGEYYKARPVHFFNDGIPGDEFVPVATDLGSVGTPICFDCDYTDVLRNITSSGAECFAVPSCDPAEWSADQHRQHALLFQHRAAENGRWIACAASSGVSQVIDAHGNVRAALPMMESGVLTHSIARSDGVTPFVRAGWLFPWLLLGATIAWIVWIGVSNAAQSMQRRRQAAAQ